MTKNDGPFVFLFSQEAPKGLIALWNPELDWMSLEPKERPSRAHQVSDVLDLVFDAYEDRVVGFKLCAFSRVIADVSEALGLAAEDRVPLDAVLLFYKGVHFGLNPYWTEKADSEARRAMRERLEFVDKTIDALRKLVGPATILQPEHARGLPL